MEPACEEKKYKHRMEGNIELQKEEEVYKSKISFLHQSGCTKSPPLGLMSSS